MNSKALVSALIAVCLTASTSAFAQHHDRQDDRGRNEHAQRGGQSDHGRNEQARRGHQNDHDRGRNDRNDRNDYRAPAQDARNAQRGAGPRHDMRKGGRISSDYRSRQYVVNDWRGHHLNAPPRGYHWVQTGSDYVLVAIASGIIAQILLNN